MASERARRFAAGLVTKRRFPVGGCYYCEAFGLVSEVVPVCDEDHDNAVDAIAEALDAYLGAYQAEAWNTITDSPTSWPKNNAHVVLSTGKFGPCEGWVQNGVWYVVGHGALRDRPTKWTPLPEDPENPKNT